MAVAFERHRSEDDREVYRSGVYTPWALLPDLNLSGSGTSSFVLPVHLVVVALLPVVVLPPLLHGICWEAAFCVKCGYDLRGQTEPCCPECGNPFDPGLLAKNTKERP